MKVFILTYGSRGDYQPFVALAKGLKRAGHEVRLGALQNPGFAELAGRHGISFTPVGIPWDSNDIAEIRQRSPTGDPKKIMRVVMNELMFRDLEDAYGIALKAALWSDVVVSYHGQVIGQMVAETSGRPWVTAMLDPMSVPSRHRPPPGAASRRVVRVLFGRWVNPRLWRRLQAEADEFFGASVNEARRRAGLPAMVRAGSDGLLSPHLNLIAVSPSVIPPAPDWKPRHQVVGYWFLDEEDWKPSPELTNFLDGGSTPILITLGGIPESVPEDEGGTTGRAVVDACEHAHVRAVIQPGALSLGKGDLPSSLFQCADADYRWLFQRVAAAVHHCGAGTTASTLRAGIPSVAVPHAWDQPYWASVMFDRGVTPSPIARREVTAEGLKSRIEAVTTESRFLRRAAALAKRISREDGVSTAVELIERSVEEQASRATRQAPTLA